MLKVLKIALLVLAAVLAVLLIFALVLILSWPRWAAFFLLLLVVALVVGIIFLRKLLLRRKEQRFVQEVIEQDEAALKKVAGKEREELRELQLRWKEAVETLRRSHLRRLGNPLYVLPWYMVIGESGAGKTTALKSARLSSPFVEAGRATGLSGTRNCEWWFFEEAIVIDTAGRYAIPLDESRDKEEWQRFLALLARYRRREPVNGVIVALAADKLLGAPPEVLEGDGRTIRSRLDELMRVVGVKVPVYLMVTKCDLIQGMAPFTARLPEKSLDQPMGLINQTLSKDASSFLQSAVGGISEKLKEYRLLMLQQNGEGSATPAALLFPEEFEGLTRGLAPFLKGAFQENPYQETPLLRGLFFSSGRQEGTPFSHFLAALGMIADKEVLPGTSKGLFLHDFFARVLPRDRGLLAPTRRALEWGMVTRNLGLASWILLWLALSGLAGYSFYKNLTIIRDATPVAARPPDYKGETAGDLLALERYRSAVLAVETRNMKWWIPRFGLNHSRKVEAALKEKYCASFRDRFLAPFDRRLEKAIDGVTTATPDAEVSRYAEHLVRRINLVRARREGGRAEALQAKPLPSFLAAVWDDESEEAADKRFRPLYVSYLLWRSDPAELDADLASAQRRLAHLLDLKGGNLMWLVGIANREGSVPPVTLRSFWGGSLDLPGEPIIVPAFTPKGRELIDSILAEIGKAYPDPARWEKRVASFHASYREGCYASWRTFADSFPKGAGRLRDETEWRQSAERMASDDGPYLAFIKSAAASLRALGEGEGIPAWLQQVYAFQAIRAGGGAAAGAAQQAGKGMKALEKVEKALGRKGAPAPPAVVSDGPKALKSYLDALAAIAPLTKDRKQGYQLALQVFAEPGAGGSPFYAAFDAAGNLKSALGGGRDDDTFWRLVEGPIHFLWAFTRAEAGCALQSQWEEKVLQEAQGEMDQQMMQYLLGPEGPVWKFVKGPASPFLGWSPGRGYYAKEALGGTLSFDPAFFAFLTRGAKAKAPAPMKQSYNVAVTALPTDSNPEALMKPQLTRLELQCAEVQALDNLNFTVSRTFKWSPDSCTDVVLQIQVGDQKLTKKYEGPQGFPNFLHDFGGGGHTFRPGDFPGQRRALEALGVRFIRVNYQFSGDRPVAGQAKPLPQWAPRRIVHCWD